MAKLPVLNVPELVNTPLQVIADPRVQPPPTPPKEMFMFPSVTLFVVIVLPVVVALKNKDPVLGQTVSATNDIDPYILIVDVLPENVTVPADTVMSRQLKEIVSVTV
jgi:hypothetical protein